MRSSHYSAHWTPGFGEAIATEVEALQQAWSDRIWSEKQAIALIGLIGADAYQEWVAPHDLGSMTWLEIGELMREKYVEETK